MSSPDEHLHTRDNGVGACRRETPPGRVRVDGKFFSCGGQRLRVRGVTYGPFAPGPDGEPFPAPRRVAEDFGRVTAAGVNALRTYHVPRTANPPPCSRGDLARAARFVAADAAAEVRESVERYPGLSRRRPGCRGTDA